MTPPRLLDIRGLTITLPQRDRRITAVSGVDLEVERGEILGLVGESGSGKSLSMLAVLGLLPRSAKVGGSVRLDGEEILGAPERRLRKLRGKRVGMVFQDPMTALDPVMTVGAQLIETLRIHEPGLSRSLARRRAIDLLGQVAIAAPEQRIDQYPHEFSGGMRQRVVIAMAIANDPELLIADEPTTALDVTIQAQIVELLERLRRERNLGLVLITHDLGLIAGLADKVTILYSGAIVERGPVFDIFANSHHPYTRGLLRAMPGAEAEGERLVAIPGTPPSPASRPEGCPFHPRCRLAVPRCSAEAPAFRWFGQSMAACHLAEEAARMELRETAHGV
ncbi:ABC transporter ATP-binding protein [Jiella endophytica]|uniref:ABC transporter ATP-binding protein n=1 Tax=Jiella endophytica TaxID=2558362 RepID=A0A4Y8RM06_9HYPH|nr:ABC transporter ATP-binding protein [Jiella endophytica]TFF23240.1 ABC transporter ATP-binding protein [Jiella endophytica]